MAPDLGLHLKLPTTQIINNLSIDDPQTKISQLQKYINVLEEEKRKIEVFKRELPLSVHLVNDAIGAMKEEIEKWNNKKEEEMKPLTKSEIDHEDKMNWMSSAQLWTNTGGGDNQDMTKISNNTFQKDKIVKRAEGLLDLSLVPAGVAEEGGSSEPEPIVTCHVSLEPMLALRKPRRCWSPQLHRRFVFALQQLGGAQHATPKQIREVMKVDGLTNDEIKSHLQKYRIHSRRMPSGRGAGSLPMAMTGRMSGPQESNSHSGSMGGPVQLCRSSYTLSVTGEDSCEGDSKSECYNWK